MGSKSSAEASEGPPSSIRRAAKGTAADTARQQRRTAQEARSQKRAAASAAPKAPARQTRPSRVGDEEPELPPDIQEMIKAQEEEFRLHENVALALAAAHALCEADLDDDDDGDEDVEDASEVARQQEKHIATRRSEQTAKVKSKQMNIEVGDDDDDAEVSLHSSDYRDEDLMREVAELEAACASEQQQRIEELELLIAQHKKRALGLMKEGDKPAALAELRTAKQYEKELASLKLPPE